MCYAIPGRLVKKDGLTGVINYFGEERSVVIAFQDVKEGDYVYAQGGVLINRVTEREAEESLEAWKELFFALKKTDEEMAKVKRMPGNIPSNILEVLQKVNLGKELERKDLLSIFKVNRPEHLKLIYDTANNTRQKVQGNACCVHGIIEFSNSCGNDCSYCGIRSGKNLKRYQMSPDEIVQLAGYAVSEMKFKALVLQSGEDVFYDEEKLIYIVKKLKEMGILIFLSIGSREKSLYKKLFDEGARAALLRFETSNKELFERLRPGTSLDERLDLIKFLRETGYVLATGFIVGLPGETVDTIIDNIFLTKSLKPDMYSFGPFIPAEGTPLEKEVSPTKDTVLKTIACSRFVDRDAKILVTTALETLDIRARKEALLAGANSLMINVTPTELKKLYSIYDNRQGTMDSDIKGQIEKTLELLYSLGRAPTDLGTQR